MARARLIQIAGRDEFSALRIEQLSALERPVFLIPTTRNQHPSVRQQVRRMAVAADAHRRGRGEFVGPRIVDFR
jgi:hypothetical protein